MALILFVVIASTIAWLIVECKNKKLYLRLICGVLIIFSTFLITTLLFIGDNISRNSIEAEYIAMIEAVTREISNHLETSKQKDDPKVKDAIESLNTLGNISSFLNEEDINVMLKIREDLKSKQNAEKKNTKIDKKRTVNLKLDKKTAIKLAEIILVKVYGEKVLKQRPWIVTENKTEFKIKGNFHQNLKHSRKARKGGVAEIVIKKSDAKVLSYIHGK